MHVPRSPLKIAVSILVLSLSVAGFNNCGQALRSAQLSADQSSSGIDDGNGQPGTLGGTDVGNPVGRATGQEMSGITTRLCTKIETCALQKIPACPTIFLTATLPEISMLLGAPGEVLDLSGLQSKIDNKELLIDSAKLTACYAALDNLSCTAFPDPLSADFVMRNQQITAMFGQIMDCHNIVRAP